MSTSKTLSLQGPPLAQATGTADIGALNISRSGTVDMTGTQIVNFIGAVSVVLKTSTLQKNTPYYFSNTSGANSANISLDNAGTVGGKSAFPLTSGQAAVFAFDGTNLS